VWAWGLLRRAQGYADAGRDVVLAAFEEEGSAQVFQDAVGHVGGLARAANVLQQDGELVAPEARDRILRAQAQTPATGHGDEQPVPASRARNCR